MNDSLKVSGVVKLHLFDKDGNLKHDAVVKNLVTNAGKNFIVRKALSDPLDTEAISNIGIGSGTTSPTVQDTALEAESYNIAFLHKGASVNTITYGTTFEAGVGTGTTITEVGLFSDSPSPKLLCRALVTQFDKADTDYVNVSWTLTLE
jgi:hypothetical protein